MRAVWSFWSLPYQMHRRRDWASEKSHLFSWVLSVEVARRHYPETTLVTDEEGARLLVDGLGLNFSHVSTELNGLQEQDPDWWMLGKLHTYRSQQQPFIHLDYDVYLWTPLPHRVVSAPVFAQNMEEIGAAWYDVELCERVIRAEGRGQIPVEWSWYRSSSSRQQAACCGILGGNDLRFLHHYAGVAIQLLEDRGNRAALSTLHDKKLYNPLFEQYVLCACAEYHQVRIEYLFESFGEALAQSAYAGYTHLIAGAKANPEIAGRLERRVANEFPESYERCLTLSERYERQG